MPPLPNFLIIGAMKAGTTALYTYLDQHPEVYMSPVKEPNFFAFAEAEPDFQAPIDRRPDGVNRTSITDLRRYRQLFASVTDETAIGEASHWYLYWPAAPANIQRYVPEARLVAMLRNPIERAYSEYLHFVRDGDEPIPDFGAALEAEPDRIAKNWALGRYVDRGRYYAQLRRYYDRFDPGQLRVSLHDDFVNDPTAVLRDLFAFLGVDETFEPERERRINKSGVPKQRWLHRALTAARPLQRAVRPLLPDPVVDWANALKNRNLEKPELDPEVRMRLADALRDDVLRLQDLIGRDLTHWLESSSTVEEKTG